MEEGSLFGALKRCLSIELVSERLRWWFRVPRAYNMKSSKLFPWDPTAVRTRTNMRHGHTIWYDCDPFSEVRNETSCKRFTTLGECVTSIETEQAKPGRCLKESAFCAKAQSCIILIDKNPPKEGVLQSKQDGDINLQILHYCWCMG